MELAHRCLADLPTGGRTPLWAGIERAAELVMTERNSGANVIPLLVIVSDGRANASRGSLSPADATFKAARTSRSLGVRALVLDTEEGYVKLGMMRRLAEALGGEYVAIGHLDETSLAESVRLATRELSGRQRARGIDADAC